MKFGRKKRNLVLAMAILGMVLGGCSKAPEGESEESSGAATGKATTISVEEFNKNKDDYQVIDTRDTYQYNGWGTDGIKGGHIEGALVFPEDWLPNGNVNPYDTARLNLELGRINADKSKKTLIYADDTMTEESSQKYLDLGFTDVAVLEGGMSAYEKAGLPVDAMKNYSVLVHPQWVQDLADEKNPETYKGKGYKIIEFGGTEEDYEAGHIKNAIHVGTDILDVPGPGTVPEYDAIPMEVKEKFWNRPSDEILKAKMEEVGIEKDDTVVVYAATKGDTWGAARFALLTLYCGVEDVRLLDGGKSYAQSEGIEMVTEVPEVKSSNFGKVDRTDAIIDYDKELELVNDPNAVIASIRCWEEYIGKESGYPFIGEAGDIAKSRFGYAGTSFADYRNPDNTMFSYPLMVERWAKWGIVPEKTVSFHCGTGYRASETYLYAKALGWENIHMYDGGWYEWHLHKDAPRLEKGLPEDAPEQAPDFTRGIPMK